MPVPREVVLTSLTVLLATLVGLSLAEVGVRLAGIAPNVFVLLQGRYRLSDNPILKYELVPGRRDEDRTHRISQLGLRDREFEVPKPQAFFASC